MNKKYIIVIISILLVLGITILLIIHFNNKRVYLSDKYYNEGNYIPIKSEDLDNIKNDTYLLFVYNDYCSFQIPCDQIFKEFMDKYKIDMYSMKYIDFKKTQFYGKIIYAPSVILVKNNKIKAYLDADAKEHLDIYQDSSKFETWVKKYIYFTKLDTKK